MTATQLRRSPGAIEDAKVQLEGEFDAVLELLPHYRRLEEALRRRRWKDALYSEWHALDEAVRLDLGVQRAVRLVEHRAALEGWQSDSEALRLVRQVKQARAKLEAQAARRGDGALELGPQLQRWHTELAEQLAAGQFDEEFPISDGPAAAALLLLRFAPWFPPAVCSVFLWRTPFAAGKWWAMLALLVIFLAMAISFSRRPRPQLVRTHLRFSRSERTVEVWSGDHLPRQRKTRLQLGAGAGWSMERRTSAYAEAYWVVLLLRTEQGFQEVAQLGSEQEGRTLASRIAQALCLPLPELPPPS